MGGKSKSVTVGYKHYVGMHWVFCHGPIDYFSRVSVDDRVAWRGKATGGSFTISAPELFGGESREGGVSGSVDVAMGAPTQSKNAYLLSKIGPNIPAYRGVAALIFKDAYWGNNPYLKPVAVRGTRIHKAQDNATQWYDPKAEIPSGNAAEVSLSWLMTGTLVGSDYVVQSITPSANQSATYNSGSGQTDTVKVRVSGSVEKRTYPGAAVVAGSVVTASGDGSGVFNVYKMTISNPAATYYFNHGTPQGGIIAVDETFEVQIADGATITYVANDGGDGKMVGASQQLSVTFAGDQPDMNPAHVIRECLTNEDWGMGYDPADIDDESFEAAADQLLSERLGISLLWDRQTKIEDFINEVIRHADAALFVSRKTGKFVLKLIRDDYDPDALITLDESNIDKIANPSRPTDELVNSVTVAFWNTETGKDDAVTVQDPAGVQMQGAQINTTLQYPGFTYNSIATRVAGRDLRALSNPFLTCTIYTGEAARDLDIGDVFKLTWGKWYLQEVVMRVTGFAMSEGKSTQIRITCVEDVFATPLTAIIAPPGDGWTDPSQPPEPTENEIAFEAPYFELVQINNQSNTDSDLATNPLMGFVMAAAARPASAINAKLWTDAGDGFEEADTMDFAPTGTLVGALDQITESAVLANGSDLDLVQTGTHFQIDEELLRIDSIDPETGAITFGRGVLDTVPARHEAGARAYFWDAYAGGDPTEYASGETVDVRITPISGAGQAALADANEQSVTLNQRAARPYAPGDMTINGDSYAEQTYSGELTVEWVGRDRTQQTSGELTDHFDANIGPEAGVTYRLRVYVDDVLDQEIDPAASPQAVTPGGEGIVRIEVSSMRDDLESWQAAHHEFPYSSSGSARAIESGDYRNTEDGFIRVTED